MKRSTKNRLYEAAVVGGGALVWLSSCEALGVAGGDPAVQSGIEQTGQAVAAAGTATANLPLILLGTALAAGGTYLRLKKSQPPTP